MDAKDKGILAASAAKKMVVDWPAAGAAGFARKLAPFAPLDKWEGEFFKPSTWDLDPGDQHGLFDYFNIWNPRVLRGPGEIEKWFHPAVEWASKKVMPESWRQGFKDWKGEGSIADKMIDGYFDWLNETGQKIEDTEYPMDRWMMEILGFDDGQIANIKSSIVNKFKGADPDTTFNELLGTTTPTDKISAFGEGVFSPTTEVKEKYNNLMDTVKGSRGEDVIVDGMQAVWNNPAYFKVDINNDYYNYISNFDSSLADNFSKKAFLNNAEALQLAQAVGPENTATMDLFFIDTSHAPLEKLNYFFNNWTGDENNNPNKMLTSNAPTLITGLRELAAKTSQHRGDDKELALSQGKKFVMHASDASDDIRTFYDMAEDKNKYMFFSPTEKTSAGIFDMRELPFVGEAVGPGNFGKAVTGLKESFAHGVEQPWMATPEELKPYEAFLKREHVQMTPDGLQVVPYEDELISSQQEAWAALDPGKQKELLSLWQAPVDAAIVGSVIKPRAKKLMNRGVRSLDVDPLLTRAIDQAATDFAIQQRGQ